MFNPNLDQLEDVLTIIQNECPSTRYSELIGHECNCDKVQNCFECWYESVIDYSFDKCLGSMDDGEEKSV